MNKFKSIILIDDDEISNFLCEETIMGSNIAESVVSYVNANDALEFLNNVNQDNLPDIIFLDINMPGMDGWEFLSDLENIGETAQKQIKVIILSSSHFHIDIERSKNFESVAEYVSKPLTSQILETILTKYSQNDLSTSLYS